MRTKSVILKVFLILILFQALLSCNIPADSPYSPISFQKKSTMPGNGRSSAVAFAINGKGYVALGRDSLHNPLNDCWEYDPTQNNWTPKSAFPGTARVKAIGVSLNGKGYVGLGFNPLYGVYSDTTAYLKDFWMYDPQTDIWTQKAKFPSRECDANVSFVYGNYIYVGSGFNGYGFYGTFFKYDAEQDDWTKLNSFPGMARTGAVICTNGEHVYFGTGYNTYNENDWWEYFPSNDSWKSLKTMPDKGRENGVSLSINNRYFVSTGRQFGGPLTGGHVKSDIYEYDAVRNIWYNRGNIPQGNRENAVTFVINGIGYIGFGENNDKVLNDLWSFEP